MGWVGRAHDSVCPRLLSQFYKGLQRWGKILLTNYGEVHWLSGASGEGWGRDGKGGVDEAEGGMSDEDGRMERGARKETCMEWGRGGLGAC